ncbi:MAG: sulfite exporter TauE/SafE family protein [Actinomycetota bacterium]
MITLLIAVLLGLIGGILAGLYGVGGGIIFVPTLALVFGLGQVEAEATSLLAIIPTVVAGTWRQHRYGHIRWRAAAVIGFVAIAGVELGVLAAKSLPEHTLQRLFGAFLLVVAAQLAWRSRRVS